METLKENIMTAKMLLCGILSMDNAAIDRTLIDAMRTFSLATLNLPLINFFNTLSKDSKEPVKEMIAALDNDPLVQKEIGSVAKRILFVQKMCYITVIEPILMEMRKSCSAEETQEINKFDNEVRQMLFEDERYDGYFEQYPDKLMAYRNNIADQLIKEIIGG